MGRTCISTSIGTMTDQRCVTEVDIDDEVIETTMQSTSPQDTLLNNNHADDLCTKRNGKWMAFVSVLVFAVATFVLVALTYREGLEVNSEGTLQSTNSHEAVQVGLMKTSIADIQNSAISLEQLAGLEEVSFTNADGDITRTKVFSTTLSRDFNSLKLHCDQKVTLHIEDSESGKRKLSLLQMEATGHGERRANKDGSKVSNVGGQHLGPPAPIVKKPDPNTYFTTTEEKPDCGDQDFNCKFLRATNVPTMKLLQMCERLACAINLKRSPSLQEEQKQQCNDRVDNHYCARILKEIQTGKCLTMADGNPHGGFVLGLGQKTWCEGEDASNKQLDEFSARYDDEFYRASNKDTCMMGKIRDCFIADAKMLPIPEECVIENSPHACCRAMARYPNQQDTRQQCMDWRSDTFYDFFYIPSETTNVGYDTPQADCVRSTAGDCDS